MEVRHLERGMYVRCPVADFEDPRDFITGKIIGTDDFTEIVSVAFLDPFGFRNYYENIPEKVELPCEYVKRCTLLRESYVMYRSGRYTILSTLKEDEWYYYYLKEEFTDRVIKVREDVVDAPFNGGRISPAEQLKSYEFQNPAWYFGRSIVSKTVKILDNSVFGFKELAGCKIFLKEHQLKTIMRCLQEKNCRVMLADEVGMGKTVEAAMESEIASYYSDLSKEEKRSIIDRIKNRKLRLLFISPEALIKNEVFKQVIEAANDSGYLRNLIIDEAHIVIEWGNFFRVDYQCLEPWRNNLYEKNSKLKTVLLSATYEKNTVKILQSMFATGDKWIEIRCDALRREPRFELVTATSFRDKNEKTRELLRCLPRPMVVYVMRPDQAEKVKEIAADIGITNVETFTGKTKADERSRIINEWSENEFDIIVATSAFGVGVDKSDVRTVLHLYVPDNPNAYYQELGRGGRDGLPCLSVMCVYPDEDLESAFVMTDKVLGSDKILGRWDSMLNSHTSTRGIDYCTLDTSVKPSYNSVDYAEDTSTVDQKWNIYVILLLRRYNLIKILDMVVDPKTQVYFIRVSILDKQLLQITDQTRALIEEVRAKEWTKNEKDFKTMSRAVRQGKRMCWSEMFFNSTYSMVSEYCAGCDNHKNIVDSDPMRFELVKKIPSPTRKFSVELDNMFASSNEAILFSDIDNTELIGRVINRGFSTVIINDEEQSSYFNLLNSISEWTDVNLLGMNEFMRLVEHGDYYYFAGDAIVLYGNTEQNIYKKLSRLRKTLGTREVRLLHVFREDIYCNEVNKTVSSIVDGPVIEEYLIERM